MTKRNDFQVIILCEDRLTFDVIKRYLVAKGFHPRKIRPASDFSEGMGAGEQHVREEFPSQLRDYRRKTTYQNIVLVVVTDADNYGLTGRIRMLHKDIPDDLPLPKKDEKIATLIPEWCTESWLLYGAGEAFQEDKDDKKRWESVKDQHKIKDIVNRYATEICVGNLPDDAPQSLHHACDELAKIL